MISFVISFEILRIYHAFTDLKIGEVKSYAWFFMQHNNTLIQLLCFLYEYATDDISLLANGWYVFLGQTDFDNVVHYTLDISKYVSFQWFIWYWYFNKGKIVSVFKVACPPSSSYYYLLFLGNTWLWRVHNSFLSYLSRRVWYSI